jgi:periplasmic divalent cation tolerance protein
MNIKKYNIMNSPLIVYTTVTKKEDARKLCAVLLKMRLVACAQIHGPIISSYWWNDTLEESEEYSICMKTCKTVYPLLEKKIKEHHPYELPEIIATNIVELSKEYMSWMEKELEI